MTIVFDTEAFISPTGEKLLKCLKMASKQNLLSLALATLTPARETIHAASEEEEDQSYLLLWNQTQPRPLFLRPSEINTPLHV